MNSTQNESSDQSLQDRKARIILMGAGLGALFGLLTSYLYARAAEENDNAEAGTANSVSTGQLLAASVSCTRSRAADCRAGQKQRVGKDGKEVGPCADDTH